MSYKKTIDNFLINRYNYLTECSKNILKFRKELEPGDLIAELAIYLYNNQDKVTEYIKIDKLEAFCVTWLNVQGKYATSQVNKKYSNKFDEIDSYLENITASSNSLEKEFDIDRNEYEKDLFENMFTDEQIRKIMEIDSIIDLLTPTELILFKAYFIENLSYDKITNKYTFFRDKDGKKITYKSKKSIYTLMQQLKDRIYFLIREQNGNN
jgi:hypothetical protein